MRALFASGQAGMDDCYEHDHRLRALAMRVAALEDNVAFLEEWCEEQQDVLDRTAGPAVSYGYEMETEPEPLPRAVLRVVDLRDDADRTGAGPVEREIIALVETEHDRKVRQIRARLDRLRQNLATTGYREASRS